MNPYQAIKQHCLSSSLASVSLRELFFEQYSPCDLYRWHDEHFALHTSSGDPINKKVLAKLLSQGTSRLFAHENDYQKIITTIQGKLVQVTRSLSIGKPVENGLNVLNLLSLNMHYLYEFPSDNTTLQLQVRCGRNIARFLIERPKIHRPLIQEYLKQKHHYIFAQPILASIFLLGILSQSKWMSAQEIERLFLISLLKDIGMSVVPIEKYEQVDLAPQDKEILLNHSDFSVMLLEGRTPFEASELNIIRHHHAFSLLDDHTINEILEKKNLLMGMETTLVSMVDIIAAMISTRPYRQAGNLYDALELSRILIANKFPQEFKLIVSYFKDIFAR